jgi:Ca2+-binding RTX toxin-like protein
LLQVERLEDRQLMSVGSGIQNAIVGPPPPIWYVPVDNPKNPGISLQSGDLVIQGSTADDTATVNLVLPTNIAMKPMLQVTLTTTPAAVYVGQADINTPVYYQGMKTTYQQSFDPTQVAQIIFFGDAGNDSFTNGSGIACSAYGTGSDHFVGGIGTNYLQGGAGSNVFEGGGGSTTIVPGAGDNQFVFAATDLGSVTINNVASGGQNVLDFSKFGPSGVTVDLGLTTKQTVHRTNGVADLQLTLTGAGLINEVLGSPYADVIKGGTGSDVIEGGGGNDTLIAGPGNNRFVFATSDLGSVTIGGNTAGHNNVLDFSTFGPSGITLNLASAGLQTVHQTGGVADLQMTLAYSGGMQEVQGTPYADVIHADDHGDVIHGNGGSDRITGGLGGDHLYADSGDCSLYSGGGAPSFLYGGMGASLLCTVGGSGQDTVTSGSGQYSPWGGDSLWVGTTDTLHYNSILDTRHHVHKVDKYYSCSINGVSLGAPGLSRNGPYLASPDAPGTTPASFGKDPLFAVAGPSKDDVVQGNVGDCYLMSFLAGMAKADPGRVRQYVADLGDGTYAVNFQDANQQNWFVRVNAQLPTTDGTNLAFARLGTGSSIWVPIIENAWAFFRTGAGTYASIAYSPVGEDTELGTAFAVSHQLTVHNILTPYAIDAASYLNTIRDAWLAGKVVEITGPYDNGANPWTDQSATIGSDFHNRAHAYMVDQVTLDGNGNVVSITVRDPYATSGNGKGYVTLSAATVAYCSNEIMTFDPINS